VAELIDTTIWVGILRGRPEARRFLRRGVRQARRPLYSVITKAEIYAGLRPGQEMRTAKLLRRLRCVPVTEDIAEKAGEYMRLYAHTGMELADALIAATAWAKNARLITLNARHFPMTDIQVEVPY